MIVRSPFRPLRRKLVTTFTALGLLGGLVITVTGHTIARWHQSEQEQARHYTRSLRLQEVRALTFEAFKEVPDAVIGGDANPREDYERRLRPINRAFEEWVILAEDGDERAEVAQVRSAASQLDASAQRVFSLVESGNRDAAIEQLETVEETAFEPFDAVTTAAVTGDRAKRQDVRAEATQSRQTAYVILAVATIGVISLLLLTGAYLTGGVFAPVRRLRDALRAHNAGERDIRLADDGNDEIAEVNAEFNRLAASAARNPTTAAASGSSQQVSEYGQFTVNRMLRELRAGIVDLDAANVPVLLAQMDGISTVLNRAGLLAHPAGLNPTTVDLAALLHEVFDRVDDEVIRRSVSTTIAVDADCPTVIADRARLRETMAELVRNALDALPRRGGTLQLRTRAAEPGWIVLEVQDSGHGISADDISWFYEGTPPPGADSKIGLRLVTSVIEQHGGHVQLETVIDGGTIARLHLPVTSPPHDKDHTR